MLEKCTPDELQLFLQLSHWLSLSQFLTPVWKSDKSQVIPYVVFYLDIKVDMG